MFYQLCMEQVLWKVLRKTGKSIQLWKSTWSELFKAQNCKLRNTGKGWVLALLAKKPLWCLWNLCLVCSLFGFCLLKAQGKVEFILNPSFHVPSAGIFSLPAQESLFKISNLSLFLSCIFGSLKLIEAD